MTPYPGCHSEDTPLRCLICLKAGEMNDCGLVLLEAEPAPVGLSRGMIAGNFDRSRQRMALHK